MIQQCKIPSAKPIWNGFCIVTVRGTEQLRIILRNRNHTGSGSKTAACLISEAESEVCRMKYAVTASEMNACDHGTIEQVGLPAMVLMERAALAVAEVIIKRYPDRNRVLIVAGKGNNGGDGLAIGRLLAKAGRQVTFFQMQGNYSEEAWKQREILQHLGFSICGTWPDGEYDIIIDALFGIGITGEVREEARAMIRKMNEYRCSFRGKTSFHGETTGTERLIGIAPVICAVDLPSGIDTDTGAVCGEAVKADLTVTFQYLKKAHLLYPGREYCGKVYLRDVGIEDYGICAETAFTYEKEEAKKLLPPRKTSGHKGTFGKVLLYAGSREMSGAALLCARAVLCSGAGMLKVLTEETNNTLLRAVLPEAILTMDPVKDLEWADVLVAGPGIGTSKEAKETLTSLLRVSHLPMVLDADALNLLAENPALMELMKEKALNQPVILTPHPGEFLRLSGIAMTDYQQGREKAIRTFQNQSHCILVSKDACTMVTDGTALYLNSTGNDGMATAGSGDVLTGVIGSILAQGLPAFEAASKGVFLHGLAGDEAVLKKGKHGMIASDLIENLWTYLE